MSDPTPFPTDPTQPDDVDPDLTRDHAHLPGAEEDEVEDEGVEDDDDYEEIQY